MILLNMPSQVLIPIILVGGLLAYFLFIRPFLKGYSEGMSETEKQKHVGIKTLRTGQAVGFKNIIIIIAVVIGIIWVFNINANDINSNQHTVHQSNGSAYQRTNPNNSKSDNIGKNKIDTFLGVVLVLGGGILVYRFLNKS